MKYRAALYAENGASTVFGFEANSHDLAEDHVQRVAADPGMNTLWDEGQPSGKILVLFRRDHARNWHRVAEPVRQWEAA